MQKLLVICGPTATGKTSLALHLARNIDAALLSADSRQIFRHMDIGTGKDIPVGFVQQDAARLDQASLPDFYTDGTVDLWGYDLVDPDGWYSVADYIRDMRSVVSYLWSEDRLPIIVGGSGHYIDSLIAPPESVGVPPDMRLRRSLDGVDVATLAKKLQSVDVGRYERMNMSDRHNPRRLLRALEVSTYLESNDAPDQIDDLEADVLWVGLMLPLPELKKRIHRRVLARVDAGMEDEVRHLMEEYSDWSHPAFAVTGYRLMRLYIEGSISLDAMIDAWTQDEYAYARRQMTWFRRQAAITWFDVTDPTNRDAIADLVQNWYA